MGKPQTYCTDAFFEKIGKWLNGANKEVCSDALDYRRITGVINIPTRATIEILFIPSLLKQQAPIVLCDEEWVRRELDWHCLRGGGPNQAWNDRRRLCWIHPGEWLLAHSGKKPLSLVIEEGGNWLQNNVTQLLTYHWIGHELGIKQWREEWGGWGHGDIGTRQFLEERKALGHPNNWKPL